MINVVENTGQVLLVAKKEIVNTAILGTHNV